MLTHEGNLLAIPEAAKEGVLASAKQTLHRLEEAFADPAQIDGGEEAERLPAIARLFAITTLAGVCATSLKCVFVFVFVLFTSSLPFPFVVVYRLLHPSQFVLVSVKPPA